jgi:hypothetical protein
MSTETIAFLTDNPEAVFVLALLMRGLLAWQSELSWYEYRTLHGVKRMLFPVLDRFVPVSLVNPKQGRDDAEYIETRENTTTRELMRELRGKGFSLHLLCSLKQRPDGAYTSGHAVYLLEGGDQVEAYTFENDDGSVDVYAHTEPSPGRPLAHLGGDSQVDGDQAGVLPD